jgi:hypothetical protein
MVSASTQNRAAGKDFETQSSRLFVSLESRIDGALKFAQKIKTSQTYLKFSGISPFPLGSLVLVRRFSFRSAALRPLKVESDINGILPAGGGPLPFISFLA